MSRLSRQLDDVFSSGESTAAWALTRPSHFEAVELELIAPRQAKINLSGSEQELSLPAAFRRLSIVVVAAAVDISNFMTVELASSTLDWPSPVECYR